MKERSAFTLIELLVVIAIIALLVSILMPSLQKAKEMAKDVVCLSHQRNVSLAIYLYAQDYDDTLPYTRGWDSTEPQLHWEMRVGRAAPTQWLEDNHKPADLRIVYKGYVDYNNLSHTEGTFKCPSAWDQVEPKGNMGNWYSHFSVNGALINHFGLDEEYDINLPSNRTPVECVRISDVKSNNVVLLGDCNLGPAGGKAYPSADYPPLYWGYRKESDFRAHGPWPYLWFINGWQQTQRCDFYGHTGEKSNLTFLDGHAEGIKDLVPEDFNPQARVRLY